MQAFWLDRESGIPVRLQFMAQVRYQIAAGLLYPGDQLPSLRDLAEGLSINLNTVVRAVDQLIAEGYLYSQQGRGIYVAEIPPGQQPGAALRSLLTGTLAPAQGWGMSAEELALALLAQAHLAKPHRPTSQRLLLIGTAQADLRRIQRQLETALPQVTVVPRLPEEVGRPGTVALTVTTLFHAPAGASTVPGSLTLASPDESARFEQLRRLPAGSLVALAAGDWVQGARIRQSLEANGLGHLRYASATRAEELRPFLPEASAVLAAQSGLAMAKEAQAQRPDLLVIAEPVQVTEAALATIRQSLGSPPPAPRPHLRSAWV